ncbi:MAG: DUF3592 domain-containing protein [Casimicrobiaceae bacterium]
MTGFAAVTAIVSIVFLFGAAFALRTHLFVRRAMHVRASVVGRLDESVNNHDAGSQSAPTTRYIVEIPRHGERPRRVMLAEAFGGSVADKLVSDDGTIKVLYDPARPAVVRIDSWWTLYFVPVFLCAPGLLWLAVVAYIEVQR